MNYPSSVIIKIVCCILIVIVIIITIFKLIFIELDEEGSEVDTISEDSNNDLELEMVDMFADDINDTGLFSFEQTSKIQCPLIRYTADDYITVDLSDTMLIGEIIEVPFTNQTMKYPTGCESVSATSVLQYYGIDITIDSFIDDYLDKTELTIIGYRANHEIVYSSAHPNECFIGNPKSGSGLGCYENTILNAINKVLDAYELTDYFRVTAFDDLTINDVTNYLDNNVPVIIWTTQNLVPSEEGLRWYLGDSDELFQYMKNEHCVVAIGYDETYLYCNDSLVGRIAYPIDLFEDRYIEMGSRTVIVEYIYD